MISTTENLLIIPQICFWLRQDYSGCCRLYEQSGLAWHWRFRSVWSQIYLGKGKLLVINPFLILHEFESHFQFQYYLGIQEGAADEDKDEDGESSQVRPRIDIKKNSSSSLWQADCNPESQSFLRWSRKIDQDLHELLFSTSRLCLLFSIYGPYLVSFFLFEFFFKINRDFFLGGILISTTYLEYFIILSDSYFEARFFLWWNAS